jgi:putative hydrolase of the HAD superfamily
VPQNLENTITEWWERHSEGDKHVDYVTDNLTAFLTALV